MVAVRISAAMSTRRSRIAWLIWFHPRGGRSWRLRPSPRRDERFVASDLSAIGRGCCITSCVRRSACDRTPPTVVSAPTPCMRARQPHLGKVGSTRTCGKGVSDEGGVRRKVRRPYPAGPTCDNVHVTIGHSPDCHDARVKPTGKRVLLAAPRGYCAGVERAVDAVERALAKHGAPVYVRKQIVHNLHVVHDLEAMGAVFVEEIDEVPEGAVAVLSAHGSPPGVFDEASRRDLELIDATCPLVTKVHVEARRFAA